MRKSKGLWRHVQETADEYKGELTVEDLDDLARALEPQRRENPWEGVGEAIEQIAKEEGGCYIINGWYTMTPPLARAIIEACKQFNEQIK